MRSLRFVCALVAAAAVVPAAAQTRHGQTNDWEAVAKALGRAGSKIGEVYRVDFPPSEPRVVVAGIRLRPELASTSWVAFENDGPLSVMIGELTLPTNQLAPVVARLSKADLEITAIHNHLAGETPQVIDVHFQGAGDAAKLAQKLHTVLARVRSNPAPPPARDTITGLDTGALEQILGHKASVTGGVVSFRIPRIEEIKCCGLENDPLLVFSGLTLHPGMGIASHIYFQGWRRGTVTAGELVLAPAEVRRVIRALVEYGIRVVALHNHLLNEQPPMLYLHFWGRGNASHLAQGLRAALELTRHSPRP